MRPGSRQISFFFTPSEITSVIKEFENRYAVEYHQAGVFQSPTTTIIPSLSLESSLGYLKVGDWNHSPNYLIVAQNTAVCLREISLRKGGYSYAVDQQKNPDTIILKPSGIFKGEILVAGSLSTGSNTACSVSMFQDLAKVIKKRTSRIGAFYVGPEAKEKLRVGWRLVTIASSPKEYDLVLED